MHTLIITVPAYPGRDLDAFQRRVLEGLALGVLIVPEGTLWELAELPEPGRAEVRGAPPSGSGEEPAAGAVPFSGKCAKEKREIHRRLLVYRGQCQVRRLLGGNHYQSGEIWYCGVLRPKVCLPYPKDFPESDEGNLDVLLAAVGVAQGNGKCIWL